MYFDIYDEFNSFKSFDESLQKQSKCRNFEKNEDFKKLLWQIYTKLSKVPSKSFNSYKKCDMLSKSELANELLSHLT